MYFIDRKFKRNVWRYIFQCGMGTFTIVGILLFLNSVEQGAIIASLGASTFITFTMPNSYPSRPRPLIGGYIIGVITGIACSLLARSSIFTGVIAQTGICTIIFGGIAVGLAMFLMSITNTEHAPAAGMSLALVLNNWGIDTLFFIICSVLWLKIVKVIFKPLLMDFRDLPAGTNSLS